jgi:hypothetical protein
VMKVFEANITFQVSNYLNSNLKNIIPHTAKIWA